MRSILSLLKNNYRECLFILLFLVMGNAVQADRIEGIVGVVDDTIIMVSDLKEKMAELGAPKNSLSAQRQVLELMVENIIVEKIYKSFGFPQVDPKEAQSYAQNSKISVSQATSLIMKSTLMDVMVRSRVVITDNMIQDYFAANVEYAGRQSVRLKQILIKNDEEKAQKAFSDIQGGRPFDDVAQEVSEILLSGSSDIGWIAIDDLSDNVRDAIVAANPGEVVGPFKMNAYYAVFEVGSKELVGSKDLEDVYPEIVETLQTKYQQEAFKHWLNKMMSEYFIGMYI
jgi:parvulin-like peptidyl-prolyl isomerase